VLGFRLAADLGLSVGDWVTLAARTRYEAQNADDFQIAGLINSSEPSINASGVFVDMADAEPSLSSTACAPRSSSGWRAA
jgi:ABC-type lipoprotein release transport system permease subunit